MKKINAGYQSFFEYLVQRDFPYTRYLDSKLYPREHATLKFESTVPYIRRYNETPTAWDHWIGPLQPLASMAHDAQYSLKPYSSLSDIFIDAIQPLRGVKNILRGLAHTILVPLFFLANTVRYAIWSPTWGSFLVNMKLNFQRSTAWLIDGFSSLIRGTTQLLATPLTWLIRIPVRFGLVLYKGAPDIIENEEIQRLVLKGEEALESGNGLTMDCIRHRLHEEYEKANEKGQPTALAAGIEKEVFDELYFKYGHKWTFMDEATKSNALKYLSLFKPKAVEPVSEDDLFFDLLDLELENDTDFPSVR
jgi:hypothetical protein